MCIGSVILAMVFDAERGSWMRDLETMSEPGIDWLVGVGDDYQIRAALETRLSVHDLLRT